MRAAVVEAMQLGGIYENAARFVPQQGALLDTVPEAGNDVVELLGTLVAQGVLHVVVGAEVPRFVLDLRGDEVPPLTAAADVVDRGEAAGDVVGLVVGGRRRCDQTDACRHRGERREQRRRL